MISYGAVEETATESKTKCFEVSSSKVSEASFSCSFVHAITQLFKSSVRTGNSCEYHGLYFRNPLMISVSGSRQRNVISPLLLPSRLDTCDQVSNISAFHFGLLGHLQFQYSHFVSLVSWSVDTNFTLSPF